MSSMLKICVPCGWYVNSHFLGTSKVRTPMKELCGKSNKAMMLSKNCERSAAVYGL